MRMVKLNGEEKELAGKNLLEYLKAAGFNVNTYIHGLGENTAVRQLFVDRALESWNALEGTAEGKTAGMHK